MTTRFTASGVLAALTCAVAVGCGGTSVRHGDSSDDGAGGSGGANGGGGTNPGGTGGTGVSGGTPGIGGSSSGASGSGGTAGFGGSGGLGGVGAVSGTAGAAGEPDLCFLPPEVGTCRALGMRYAFDPKTGLCLPFTYGGCGGNANNFETAESCYETCIGDHPERSYCDTPLDCALVPSTCCGECNEATLANRVAINTAYGGTVNQAMGCLTVDCNPCDAPLPNPWLGATCRDHRCVAFDARQTDLVNCTETADCQLRAGLDCCENCGATAFEFVALNREADLLPELCGNEPFGCDACAPIVPPGLSATCEAGRCRTVFTTE